MLLEAAAWALAGLVGGFFLSFPAFAVILLGGTVVLAVIGIVNGGTFGALLLGVVVGLVAAQIGYFLAVVARGTWPDRFPARLGEARPARLRETTTE